MDLDMWPLRALLLLACCSGLSATESCNMTKVYLDSCNFHTRLHWDEVKIPGREVRYSVKYSKYGDPLQMMIGCQNISKPFCDLSSVMMDVRNKYYGRIMADGLCLGKFEQFVPIEKTTLEAPERSMITAGFSLTVTVTTPMGPQNRSIREISCWEKCQEETESSVNYIVKLTHPESEAGKEFKNTSDIITLNHLHVNTEYCGVVWYELTHPYLKRQSENTTFCVTLPGAYKPWIPIFILFALVVLFFLIILPLILCHQYVTRKRKLPKMLVMSKNTTPDFNPDPKVEITTVKVHSKPPWNTNKPKPASSAVPEKKKAGIDVVGYIGQDYHNQDWHCHSYSNEKVAPVSDKSAKSCISYSMVVSVIVPQDREELSSCANDSGIGESISPGLSSCTDEDLFPVISRAQSEEDLGMMEPVSTSETLVLPVSLSANGKLQLSTLAFQPVVSNVNKNSEIVPLMPRSSPAGERTLLLTDLVSMDNSDWTDNDSRPKYRKAYLPNGVPQTFSELPSCETISKVLLSDSTSNYRENWVPGILPDPLPNATNCMVANSQLHEFAEPEEDVEESPSKLEAIFLSGWMVQIQG
ncbi:interferon lambda receptor 1 isoform X2 [Hemibagrus wyckioides]|uniref:interferon lambda receptor 1 isoform X2 n=1 Tax=Hemibagrus wyckioides TaxID=337641 RepID=UPI00266CAA87|nr:interferon lambda receptor 1 isoform X2 [Hemibagrus wyckioides]